MDLSILLDEPAGGSHAVHFALAGADAVALLDAWKKQFPALRLTCIGKIRSEPGLSLRDKTGIHTLESHGYVHFA